MTAGETGARGLDARPGVVAALVVFCIYGGIALSVDFPKAAMGIQSDEATYYLMGHSLAQDGDLTYRREDLERVWREFAGGPAGVFLKRGVDVQGFAPTGMPPFFRVVGPPDPDPSRLYFGKSFAYPLAAAPLVALFGTNGFLLLHAIILALLTLCAYLFIQARTPPLVAVLLATGFLMASVAPAYFVWITPELFNLATTTLGFFCWLYKEVAPAPARPTRLSSWLFDGRSDLVAALLLGLASFSKPSNLLLIAPVLLWLVWKRQWLRAAVAAVLFAAVFGGGFFANIAITGEWNYQGGDRRTCYGPYPFQTANATLERCLDRGTDAVLADIIMGPYADEAFLHNLGSFFIGRYSGLVPYFFPGVFALVAFALARRRREAWQYLVLAAIAAEIFLLLFWIPYNYFGGGGVLGNRYFMSTYGLFLFLLPPMTSMAAAVLPWVIGCLFTAKIVLNPFAMSFRPNEPAKHGPLRMLPIELSLVTDLPVNTEGLNRRRVEFGEAQKPFLMVFVDDNAFDRESQPPPGLPYFWVRGDSRADLLIRSATAAAHMRLTVAAGAVPVHVHLRAGAGRVSAALDKDEVRQFTLALGTGFPYAVVGPDKMSWVWRASVAVEGGFVPMFTSGGPDARYLGVRVEPAPGPVAVRLQALTDACETLGSATRPDCVRVAARPKAVAPNGAYGAWGWGGPHAH